MNKIIAVLFLCLTLTIMVSAKKTKEIKEQTAPYEINGMPKRSHNGQTYSQYTFGQTTPHTVKYLWDLGPSQYLPICDLYARDIARSGEDSFWKIDRAEYHPLFSEFYQDWQDSQQDQSQNKEEIQPHPASRGNLNDYFPQNSQNSEMSYLLSQFQNYLVRDRNYQNLNFYGLQDYSYWQNPLLCQNGYQEQARENTQDNINHRIMPYNYHQQSDQNYTESRQPEDNNEVCVIEVDLRGININEN